MKISDIEWETVVETIENEACILFIGPEIYRDDEGHTLEDQLEAYLDENLRNASQKIMNFYKDDGLFLFNRGSDKTSAYYKIKKFYEAPHPKVDAVMERIARIPFHLIISMVPDQKCYNAFVRNGFRARSKYHWKGQNADYEVAEPHNSDPVIYNLLGHYDKQESMILDHDDLFDYFQSIFREDSIPENIRLALQSASNFLFLGIDFKKWYMQLLLRILKLKSDNLMRYAANQEVSDDLKTFYEGQFEINFIPSKIDAFLSELTKYCDEVDLSRKAQDDLRPKIEILSDQLSEAFDFFTYEEAMENIRIYLDDLGNLGEDYLKSFHVIKSDYSFVAEDAMTNSKSWDSIRTARNGITTRLLEMLSKTKNFG